MQAESEQASTSTDIMGDVPWKPADGFKAVALLFILFFLIAQITVFVGLLLRLSVEIIFPLLAVLTFVPIIFSVWFFTVRKYNASLEQLGFRGAYPPGLWSYILIFVIVPLAYIILIITINFYAYLLDYLAKAKVPELPVIQLFGSGKSGFILAFLVIVILAPITEELFFRGFLYTAFRKKWGIAVGVFLSSLAFAFFHFQLLLLVPMVLIGGILALLYEWRKSLIAPILLHALNNFAGLLYLYYRP